MKNFTIGSVEEHVLLPSHKKNEKLSKNRGWTVKDVFILSALLILTLGIQAQKVAKLEQGQNGTLDDVQSPVVWVTGALDAQHNHLTEGMPVPYHLELIDLVPNDTYTITIGFDTKKGGKHAQDYITTYNYPGKHYAFGHSPEQIKPLNGTNLAGMEASIIPAKIGIPEPINNYEATMGSGAMEPKTTFNLLALEDRELYIWNAYQDGDLTVEWVDPMQNFQTDAVAVSHLKITFRAKGTTAVLAWAGNIADQETWGEGMSAISINGSPFHTYLANCGVLNGCGGKDVAIKNTAVTPPPDCDINGTFTTCEDPSSNMTFTADDTGTSYLWQIINPNNVTGAGIIGSATGLSVSVDPGSVDSGNTSGTFEIQLTVYLDVAGGQLSTICSKIVTVYDNPDFDVTDLVLCEEGETGGATFDLMDGIDPGGDSGDWSFYYMDGENEVPVAEDSENAGEYPLTVYMSSEDGTPLSGLVITARLDSDSDTVGEGEDAEDLGCYTEKTFTLTVYDNPDFDVTDLVLCEEGETGGATFDLMDGIDPGGDSGDWSFYYMDGENEVPVAKDSENAGEYPLTVYMSSEDGTPLSGLVITARLDSDSDTVGEGEDAEDLGCYTEKTFTLTVYDNPDFDVTDLVLCEEGETGGATFDLMDGIDPGGDSGDWSFYYMDGENEVPVAEDSENAGEYPLTVYMSSEDGTPLSGLVITARLDSDSDTVGEGEDAEDLGCYTEKTFTLTVYDNPDFDVTDLVLCEEGETGGATFDLMDGIDPGGDSGDWSFYYMDGENEVPVAEDSENAGEYPLTVYMSSEDGTPLSGLVITARLDSDSDTVGEGEDAEDLGCYTEKTFTLTVYDNPDFDVTDLVLCEEGETGGATFDLMDGIDPGGDSGDWSFYYMDGENEVPVAEDSENAGEYPLTVYMSSEDGTPLSGLVITARLDSDSDTVGEGEDAEDLGCYTEKTFTLTVYDNPDFDVTDLVLCEEGETGGATFDLMDGIDPGGDSGDWSFYYMDGENEVPVAEDSENAGEYPLTVYMSSEDGTPLSGLVITARLDSDSDTVGEGEDAEDLGCYTEKTFTLTVYDNPDFDVTDLVLCEEGETGGATFDLMDGIDPGGDSGDWSFYYMDGENEVPVAEDSENAGEYPLTVYMSSEDGTPLSGLVITARLDSDSDTVGEGEDAEDLGCYTEKTFTLTVYDNPDFDVTDLVLCEEGETGGATFDLMDGIDPGGDSGDWSFYYMDGENEVPVAEDSENAGEYPLTVYMSSEDGTPLSGLVITARLDSDSDTVGEGEDAEDLGCYTEKTFTLTVYDNPDPAVNDEEVCVGEPATFSTAEVSGYEYQWYYSTDNGSTFIILEGKTGYSYTTEAVDISDDGTIYKVVVTDTNTDNCEGEATATLTVESCAHIFPTQTDCCDFAWIITQPDPSQYVLNDACITIGTIKKGGGTEVITNAVPGVFFYYSEVGDLPAGTTTILVDQEIDLDKFWFDPQNESNVRLYTNGCENISITVDLKFVDDGDVEITVDLAEAVQNAKVGVKYDMKSIIGAKVPNVPNPSATFKMLKNGVYVPGSTGEIGLNTSANCLAEPTGGYVNESCPAPTTAALQSTQYMQVESMSLETVENGFNVAPVPFKESISVQYDFEYTSNVTLEFYNLNGQLLRSYKDKQVTKGDVTDLTLDFATKANQIYILRVITDRDVFFKKILSGN